MPEEQNGRETDRRDTCREKIMSEEYRDFIYETDMPFEMELVAEEQLCEQEI